jgi:DNA sulfur modification protein DndD
MIFTELVLQNFGVYSARQTINLQTQDNSDGFQPIILLGGMNGGGKTTLMDAIRLVLYGQRARCSTRGNLSYSEFLKQSINKNSTSGDTTCIELSFEHIYQNSWKVFKVVRAWQRNSQEIKDSLSISIDNDYDDNLAANWDEYIENILPLGISNLFLFDGEQVKELAELEIPPSPVIEAINTLLGLELAEKLSIDLEVLVSRKRKALAGKAQLQTIEEVETKLSAQKQEQNETKKQLTSLQKQLNLAHKKCDKAIQVFKKEGGKIAAEREYIEGKINNLNKELETERQHLRKLAEGRLTLLVINSLLSETIERGKKELKIQQFQQSKHILEERDRKLLIYLTEISLAEDIISKIQFFIDRENQDIQSSMNDRGQNFLDIDEELLQQIINTQQNILPFQQEFAREKLTKVQEIQNEIDLTEQQLAKAASPEDYAKLDKAVQQARQELSNCQTQYDREKLKLEDLDRQIDRTQQELTRKLKNYSDDAIERANDEHLIESAEKIQHTLKLFREKLTLKKLNKLETEITECFRYLLHKSDL